MNDYLDLFINTSLNRISIRSRLVNQPKNKLISYSEQLFDATNLLPITLGVILPLNPRGKTPQNIKFIWDLWIRIKILKYILSKYYWIAVLVHRSYVKTYYTCVIKFSKIKRINGQLWQGRLILVS